MIPSVLDDTVWLLKTPTQVLGLVMGPSCSSECRAALNHPKSYLAGCHNTLTCLAQIRVQAYRTYSKCRSARFVLDFNRGPALRHLATTIVKCRQQSQILYDIMECFYPSWEINLNAYSSTIVTDIIQLCSSSCAVNCQGLHDVLAVIVWVVHCDRVAWQNADESATECLGFVWHFLLSNIC